MRLEVWPRKPHRETRGADSRASVSEPEVLKCCVKLQLTFFLDALMPLKLALQARQSLAPLAPSPGSGPQLLGAVLE